MKSKETIMAILKELEEELVVLEEEITKKTNDERNETIKEFSFTIKTGAREMEEAMELIKLKLERDLKKERPAVLKLLPIH